MKKAKNPFRFYTRQHLSELTGRKAANLQELLSIIKQVSGSCIYHHTHRFLQIHQYLSPEPPNDFAYWVSETLNEDVLGEKLASIDTIQFPTIRSLRQKVVKTIEAHLKKHPASKKKFADEAKEFHFVKTVSFVLPTNHVANNLQEFAEILKTVTLDSIYFHIFEARLRLEKMTNDFSFWIGTSIGDEELAAEIGHLDPYTRTMDDLRKTLIKCVEKKCQD